MKNTLSLYDFTKAFKESDTRKNQFSYSALEVLFHYLEDIEQQCDMEIEFDMIEICCEYTEFENLKELNKQYSNEYETIEHLEEDTTVIMINADSFIILDF